MDCTNCGRKNTKYKCIICKISICNTCAVSCSDNTPGYCEEENRVGKCSNCSIQQSQAKPKQAALSSFFAFESKCGPPKKTTSSISSTVTSTDTSTDTSTATASTASTKKTRNLSVSAANCWKETSLASYMASDWLVINTAGGAASSSVLSLNCSVCNKYAEHIRGMKHFSKSWAFDGSTNLRVTNAQDHANGEPHKRALDLYLKSKGESAKGRAERMSGFTGSEQQLVTSGISNMQASDLAATKIKFEVAYFIAKEEMPLSKYPKLLNLEEKHGVLLGNAYRNIVSCSDFITSISDELANQLNEKLSTATFYSVLTDGSNNVSIAEKEAVFVQFLDTKPPERDTIKVTTSFLKLVDLKSSSAVGIVESIKNSFRSIGQDDDVLQTKLIGFAADGASVNRGVREGVISIIQQNQPWVIYVWCVAHRLELALKDGLRNSSFDAVDNMLLRLYYLYENSPKKLRQLRDLHGIYGQTFEFEVGGVRPKRASGTRWIAHKINVLQLVVEKYGIYIQHLQSMAEDASFKPVDRQKFKGWLKIWKQARIPLLSCLFIELLSPAKALSLAFQEEDIDIVTSIERIKNAKQQLGRIEKKEVEDLPTVKRFLDKVTRQQEDKFFYQNVELDSFQTAKESLATQKTQLLSNIKEAMEVRLDVAENKFVKNAAIILNTEGWEQRKSNDDGEGDLSFADDELTELFHHFKEPLSNAGVISLTDLLEQWHYLVQYTVRYLDPSRTPYLRVWRRIFDSGKRNEWGMVLILAELLFAIPISNAKVERLFSLMKRVKTDSRASLGENMLNNLVRIGAEGPKLDDFDPTAAINLWASSANRRPRQKKRKSYKSRASTSGKRPQVLLDESSTESEENEDSDSEIIPELEELD